MSFKARRNNPETWYNLFAKSLSLRTQLLVLSLIFVVPFSGSSIYQAFSSAINANRMARNELKGISYLEPLEDILIKVPQYGRLVLQNEDGSSLKAEIDLAFVSLQSVQKQFGTDLQTTDAYLALGDLGDCSPSVLERRWQALQQMHRSQQLNTESAKLIDSVRRLFAYVSNTSSLILDSELDSFYLIHLLSYELPRTQERLGQLLLRNPNFPTAIQDVGEQKRLYALDVLFKETDLEQILQDVNISLSFNKKVWRKNSPLQKNLPPVFDNYKKLNANFLALMEQAASGARLPVDYLDLAQQTLLASAQLWGVGSEDLGLLLHVRIQSSYEHQLFVLLWTLLVLGGSSYVAWCVIRATVEVMRSTNAELKSAHEAALSATKLKSEFLANMSHEIRTPMNGIIGMTNILLDTVLDANQKRCASVIQKSADALLNLINDILDFSKIEAGTLIIEKIDFNLGEVMEDCIELLGELANRKGIELLSIISADVPTRLRGDPTRVRQLILNLAGNAVKFTEKGQVTVRVSKISETPESVKVRVRVIDTGIGISKEQAQNLFKPFRQADGSTTRKYGGTGLGLAICKKLVEMMSGEIGCESEVGRGSTFSFVLDLLKQPVDANNPEPIRSDLWGLRVLIVDDNPTNCEVLSYLVSSWGMAQQTCLSSVGVLKHLQQQADRGMPFELIILDQMMPELDGISLTKLIRTDPNLDAAQIILLTSSGKQFSAEECKELGLGACLQKPVRSSLLMDTLLSVLGRSVTLAAQENGQAAKLHQQVVDQPALPPMKLLVVDDSPTNLEVALLHLKKMGHSVLTAEDGEQALSILAEQDFDVVFMDCQMPTMDGYEATKAIRSESRSVRNRDIYIAAMTANAMQGDREKCLQAGMDDYVSKPMQVRYLQNVLRRAHERFLEQQAERSTASDNFHSTPVRMSAVTQSGSETDPVNAPVSIPADSVNTQLSPKLIQIFLTETEARINNIGKAADLGDIKTLTKMAHAIRGTCSVFGAERLSELCKSLEAAGKKGDSATALTLVQPLQQAFAETKQRLALT